MPLVELPLCAGLVGTKKCAGRVSSRGPRPTDPRSNPNPNPDPLGGSGSVGSVPWLRAYSGGVFPKNIRTTERPALTNMTRILHIVLCRPALHILWGKSLLYGFPREFPPFVSETRPCYGDCSISFPLGLLQMYRHAFISL